MLMMTCLLIACSILKVITVPTSLILMFPDSPHRRSRTKSMTQRFYSSFSYHSNGLDSLNEGGNNKHEANNSQVPSTHAMNKQKISSADRQLVSSQSNSNSKRSSALCYENMANNRTKLVLFPFLCFYKI